MAKDKQHELQTCGGWGAKIGAGQLSDLLSKLPKKYDPNLIIGYDSQDDAAIYQVSEDVAVIQTLDFFPPVVSDPYLFGQIAAANALSDVYAMGGKVATAMNIVGYPRGQSFDDLEKIMQGGAEKVQEAGGVLAGGHSIHNDSTLYGLSVMGLVHPDHVKANNAPRVGDVLIMTKKLGIGIITSANNSGKAKPEAFEEACQYMKTLNKYGVEAMEGFDVSSITDITGFGLLGHLTEMVENNVTAVINSEAVPYIEDAYRCCGELGILPGGAAKNWDHFGEQITFQDVDPVLQNILFDPQTSGGLMISVSPDDAEAFLENLHKNNVTATIVGEIVDREDHAIIVK